ncbi:MAG: HAD family hydrolase [Planctomycetota bacterium]|jgi:HAD superfamily hydrolase (TIGR01549 family)
MARRIRGILFDLGNTLLDFERVDVRSLFEAGARLSYEHLEKLGCPLPPFAKYHRRQLRAIRWKIIKSRLTRREFNSLDLIVRLVKRMGYNLRREQALEQAWLWYKPLSEFASKEEGLVELLEGFRGRGLVLGLISNTFIPAEVLDRHLAAEGLLNLLPVRVYSCEVRYRKPHPKIFAAALERGQLQAAETVFVGDSLQADIHGANCAGLISVLKDPDDRYRHPKIIPNHRVRKLRELAELVDGYGR